MNRIRALTVILMAVIGTRPESHEYTVCPGRNLKCYHGKCVENGYRCECEPGWGGRSCNVPCPPECCHGKCFARLGSDGAYCSHTCAWINKTHKFTGCDCDIVEKFKHPVNFSRLPQNVKGGSPINGPITGAVTMLMLVTMAMTL